MQKDFDKWNEEKKQAHVDTRCLVEKVGFLNKRIFAQLRKAARMLF